MKIKVRLFGVLTDVIGSKELEISEIKSVKGLLDNLSLAYPKLKKYSFQVFVNKEPVSESKNLKDGDEIALLPPFAGG
jgi:MoaD family protein